MNTKPAAVLLHEYCATSRVQPPLYSQTHSDSGQWQVTATLSHPHNPSEFLTAKAADLRTIKGAREECCAMLLAQIQSLSSHTTPPSQSSQSSLPQPTPKTPEIPHVPTSSSDARMQINAYVWKRHASLPHDFKPQFSPRFCEIHGETGSPSWSCRGEVPHPTDNNLLVFASAHGQSGKAAAEEACCVELLRLISFYESQGRAAASDSATVASAQSDGIPTIPSGAMAFHAGYEIGADMPTEFEDSEAPETALTENERKVLALFETYTTFIKAYVVAEKLGITRSQANSILYGLARRGLVNHDDDDTETKDTSLWRKALAASEPNPRVFLQRHGWKLEVKCTEDEKQVYMRATRADQAETLFGCSNLIRSNDANYYQNKAAISIIYQALAKGVVDVPPAYLRIKVGTYIKKEESERVEFKGQSTRDPAQKNAAAHC
eukprot:TRINITY_DN13056_c0_g1_i3.p1 TRINITY_DN13056_c0_g1~~TRINITY_DN13056_c0_g1_i3.p1  ORF type:complete len:448 (+),score=87.20 TRINITY_DN13056_c0_g1_i3:39-1346(+)